MSREELITRMVALNFNRFLDYYKDAVDLNVSEKDEKKDRKELKKEREHRDETMMRLYFGMGKNDHILPQKIIGKINDVTRSKNIPIGRIDLYGDYSYVDVEESFVPLILDCFADPHNNPRGIVVEVAKDQPERKKSSEKKDFGEKKERKERRDRDEFRGDRHEKRDDFREKRERKDDDFFEKKSKKKKKDFDDDRTYYKSERSRDGREWLDPDWKDHLDDIEVFIDDDDRPSRKQRNAERGFGAKKGGGSSRGGSSRGGSSRGGASRSSSSRGSSSRDSGRGRRGAARYEDDYYSPRRRGGGRRR